MVNNVKSIKNTRKYLYVTLGIIAILLSLYFFNTSFQVKVNGLMKPLTSGNIDEVRGYIKSYGMLAPAISFLLMIVQSIAAPIPAFLITFSNAAIFGWFWGAVLSWTSSMAGAAICFLLARGLGRTFIVKLNGINSVKKVEDFFENHGKHTILIARLLPFISFDIVSYAAGLTSMSFGGFMLATGVGQLPATIIYSIAGDFLVGGLKYFVMGLLILFAVSTLVFYLKKNYSKR